MVPPWVPDLEGDAPSAAGVASGTETEGEAATPPEQASPSPLAPRGRFASTRFNLGRFASSADAADARKALGHYVRSGLGGSRTATRRFGRTSSVAQALYSALSMLSAGQAVPGTSLTPGALAGKSAREVVAALVDAIQPVDGTLDAESTRNAMNFALSEVFTQFPDADLMNLSAQERALLIEAFVALEVYNRFHLDVGQALTSKAPSATAVATRSKEIRDYIRQTVAAAYRRLAQQGKVLGGSAVGRIVSEALQDAFVVFEEYVQ